jgi:hypothetical protein
MSPGMAATRAFTPVILRAFTPADMPGEAEAATPTVVAGTAIATNRSNTLGC